TTATLARRPTPARRGGARARTPSPALRRISVTTPAAATRPPASAPTRPSRTAPPATTATPAHGPTCATAGRASVRTPSCAQQALALRGVASEEARQLAEELALADQRVRVVRRQLECAVDLTPQAAHPEQALHPDAPELEVVAQIAEDGEVRLRVALVRRHRL